MKKGFLVIAFALVFALAGCTTTDYTDQLAELESKIDALETSNEELNTSLTEVTTSLEEANGKITVLEEENAVLETLAKSTNTRIKNALDRDNWKSRKVMYNADFTSYDAEYCFGIIDEDWTQEAASDYTHNGGLKFIITIEEVQWGTEIFAKDSCGNYSEFVYQSSPYSLYSTPAGTFEVGKTYEVVLYKETYFTVPQLGLLPLADMGDFGAFPEDLSAIVVTEVE